MDDREPVDSFFDAQEATVLSDEELEQLAGRAPTKPRRHPLGIDYNVPVDWWELTSAQKMLVLTDLSIFVERLVVSYHIPTETIPAWWFQSDFHVLELLALLQERVWAYSADQSPSGPSSFHNVLDMTLYRLADKSSALGRAGEDKPGASKPTAEWAVKGSVQADSYATNLEAFIASFNLRERK